MFRNHLTIAWRNLTKYKVFSLTNILGLAVGMAACLLIFQYVHFQLSFDSFHHNKDRVYRVRFDESHNGIVGHSSAGTSPGVGPAMKREMAEVEEIVRLCDMDHWNYIFAKGELVLSQKNVFMADAAFFKVFSYKLLKGNPQTALAAPGQMVISETTARKYFKNENPVGKSLEVHNNQGREVFTVTGVMEDLPANSHLDCEVLLSYASLVTHDKAAQTSWNWNAFLTYVLLKPGVDVEVFERKFPALIHTYKGQALAGTNVTWKLSLQPLLDIHLFSDLKFEAKPNGDYKTVYLLAAVALLIIIIAWSNYINLSTARAMQRAKEVSIRKVIGSTRGQLVMQFLAESFLLNLMSLLIALSVVQTLQPLLVQYMKQPLSTAFVFTAQFWVVLVCLLVFGSLLSGFYPAFVLSSFKPASVLKGYKPKLPKGLYLWEMLVMGQFAASIWLISGVLAIHKQLHYMQAVDLGMNIDQILVFKTQNVFPEKLIWLKRPERLKKNCSGTHQSKPLLRPVVFPERLLPGLPMILEERVPLLHKPVIFR